MKIFSILKSIILRFWTFFIKLLFNLLLLLLNNIKIFKLGNYLTLIYPSLPQWLFNLKNKYLKNEKKIKKKWKKKWKKNYNEKKFLLNF